MKPTSMDDLSKTIERVAENLRGRSAPARKRMSLGEFVSDTLAQIAKAADDDPDVARRRLTAVKRSVDEVLAGLAKMAAEDTNSDHIDVEVVTAFKPTGDPPIEGLTTAADQSSTEVSVTGVAAAAGDSIFAENLKEVAKALAQMKAGLDEPPAARSRKPTAKADAPGATAGGDDEWPVDLNSDAFLQGDASPEAALTWGADPAEVASPKAR
jgi:hypothetical protein